jgi:hypothetical protein
MAEKFQFFGGLGRLCKEIITNAPYLVNEPIFLVRKIKKSQNPALRDRLEW